MKKIIAIVLVLFSGGAIYAQDVAVKKHRFGVKIAPGISFLRIGKTGQERDGVDYSFGYGLQYEYGFSEYFSISTGFLMNSFRGDVTFTENNPVYFVFNETISGNKKTITTDQIYGRQYTFKAVDIPVALKLRTPEIGYLTYFAEFGTTLSVIYDSYSSKNEVFLATTKSFLSGDNEKIETDDVNLFKLGLNLGLGVEYNLVGNTSLLVGLNWVNGFTNVLKKKSNEIFYKSSDNQLNQIVKADYVALTIGVQF